MWWGGDTPDAEERRRIFTNRELLARLVPLFRHEIRPLVVGALLLLALSAAALGGPLILRLLIDDGIGKSPPDTSDRQLVILLGAAYAVLYIGSFCMSYVQTVITSRMGLRILTKLKARLFRHVLDMPVSFFSRFTPGKLLTRVESDTETMKQLISLAALQLLQNLVMVLGTVIVLFVIDWRVTALLLLGVPVITFFVLWFLKFIRKYFKAIRASVAALTGHVTEYVQGVETVRHYGYQKRASEKLAALNLRRYRLDTKTQFMEYPFWGAFHTSRHVALGVVLLIGMPAVVEGTMTLGTLILFVEFIRRIMWPLIALSEFANFIQRAFVSVERVFEILSMPTERDGEPDDDDDRPPPSFDREIRLENVTFEYEEDHPVLRNVSFSLRKGERVALVGASGGGKSTLVNLLLRFHDPKDGAVLLDGRDAKEIPRLAWRKLIGLVLQDVYLFPGSIRENLDLQANGGTDERLHEAARLVRADHLLERMGEGLDSVLVERGANLSQGERQLLSFARALAADRPVLVLDEATSSVDPYTERLIQEGLERLLEGRTSLIVAHRLSTVVNADRILVVQRGEIVEEGPHAKLYAQDGLYRKLFDLQFRQETGAAE
jgi:ATP-binding cassette, subfamily B, multidrug efflux pump